MRVVTYPLLLASLVPSLVAGGSGHPAPGLGATRMALLASVTMLCLAPLHDYMYIRGLTSVDDFYWMQYAAPIALIVFAWAQLDRLVGALVAVEGHAEQLERKVAERTRELELANAAKTRFLAAASHDLRQPVVSIGLLADLLRDAQLPPKMHLVLDRMGDSVQALNALLKGLLDLSRFDAGAVQARIGRVALRPLLESVVGDEREAARQQGHRAAPAARRRSSVHSRRAAARADACATSSATRCATPNAAACSSAARRRGEQRAAPGVGHRNRHRAGEPVAGVRGVRAARQPRAGANARHRSRPVAGASGPRRCWARRSALRSRPGRGSCFSIELPLAGDRCRRRPSSSRPRGQSDGLAGLDALGGRRRSRRARGAAPAPVRLGRAGACVRRRRRRRRCDRPAAPPRRTC